MSATLHPFPKPWQRDPKRDRTADLVRANTSLAMKVLKAERFLAQTQEYAILNGDALLAQMTREFLEGIER